MRSTKEGQIFQLVTNFTRIWKNIKIKSHMCEVSNANTTQVHILLYLLVWTILLHNVSYFMCMHIFWADKGCSTQKGTVLTMTLTPGSTPFHTRL